MRSNDYELSLGVGLVSRHLSHVADEKTRVVLFLLVWHYLSNNVVGVYSIYRLSSWRRGGDSLK